MQGLKRTHRCGELSSANIGEKVTVMGWVQKNRNKGGIVFMDLRDRSGILQIVFEGEEQAELMEKASKLRSEFVVAVVGNVEKRSGAVNENLATGEIEVRAEELRILSESEVPPFQVEENSKTKEELRLKSLSGFEKTGSSEKPAYEKSGHNTGTSVFCRRRLP